MLHAQWHHHRAQPENSPPLSWPLLLHPLRYLRDAAGGRELVLVGNPVLWWGFLATLPVLLVRVARGRRWSEVVAAGGFVLLYRPWLAIPRTQFLFYMLPAVPFMALGLVAVLRSLPPSAAWLRLLPLLPQG
jgi:dolichyl-phosphate-mannose-protein mannosyltransferase